jgi:hypothetical protein
MKRLLRMVLTGILVLSAQVFSRAGTVGPEGGTPWEDLLDRYEFICRQCLDLQKRKDAGEDIPSRKLLVLLDELEQLREQIKDVTDKMPPVARRRFEAIRRMYASGNYYNTRPLEASSLPIPVTCSTPSTLPDILHQRPGTPAQENRYPSFLAISVSVLAPEPAYGAMVSHWSQKWGWYAAFRSNYSFHRTAYDALSDGTVGKTRIWASGRSATDRTFITAGPALRLKEHWGVFGGLGYGFRRICWEDSERNWMRIADASSSGLSVEAGISWIHPRFTLSAGWISLPLSYHALALSVGYAF